VKEVEELLVESEDRALRSMSERVRKLRQASLDTKPWLSTERAEIMTEFYRHSGELSAPVRRALAFKYLMDNKSIYIGDGELIVGERGPAPKATSTFPELCCHSLQDLEIVNDRKKISFTVDDQARRTYAEKIIPFWRGRSMRDIIFSEMSEEWKAAYDAGVHTELLEQRPPGHTVLDDKIYRKGFLDFKADIENAKEKLDYHNDQDAYDKQKELEAMSICCDAIIRFAERHAEKAREMAQHEADPKRKKELERIAEVCFWVPAHAPRDFWEALQAYWFVHLGVITELNGWDSFNPGHLDQHLHPFYKKGLEEGTLTSEQAKELLQCLWVKFNNQPAPPKIGVTAEESNTYVDFPNINLGGLRPDGSDGTNDVSYLILDVLDEMRLTQPLTNIQLSKRTPDRLLKRGCEIIRKGWGQPAIFNADLVVEELVRQGKSVEDARSGGVSGCIETGCFGKEAYINTGYLNLPKILEITLNDGVDPRTGKKIGLETGNPTAFKSSEELFDAFDRQLKHFVDIKVRGNNVVERLYATYMPVPFLSILIDDCIKSGKDYNNGGARYNTTYVMSVGIGSLTDSLTAIKYHVFEEKNLSMGELLKSLKDNFQGHERLRQMLWNKTPKYGNDDEYADALLRNSVNALHHAISGRKNTKGGFYAVNYLCVTCHVYFGSVVGATPDGRRAYEPLSEGVSPVQGADIHGPTAVVKSVAKMDQVRFGGTLLNQKFTPSLLEGEEGLNNLAHLVRSYFKLDGHHIQFNVITAETLRAAQANPEKYRDLIVRVAGYSDYFCDLTRALQDEIIARTEQKSF
jgi:pyruvate formate-lyase/glycerol dehydratase family glycyl radical enzyme